MSCSCWLHNIYFICEFEGNPIPEDIDCIRHHVCTCISMTIQYSRMRVYGSLRIARTTALNIHPESRSKSGQISAPIRSFYCLHTIELRLEAGLCQIVLSAAVLADHLQLVRTRPNIKGARSLSVPKQHLPLKTGFSATSSSTTRAALRWCFPSSSRLSVSPVTPSPHRRCLWLISQRVASAVCSKRTDQQLIAILDGRPIQICFGPVEMLLCC